jgi:hypothetical protein
MKTANWMMMFLLAGVLALTGCGKEKPKAQVMDGVTIDVPKLREAFVTAGPDLQSSVSEVAMGVRYTDYPRAFAGLAKLDSAPGLTEAQKKLVSQVTEQVKQLATKAAAPPAQ